MLLETRTRAGLAIEEHVFGEALRGERVLIVAFHGRGGTPGLPSLAHVRAPARVLVPHGPHGLGTGLAWSPLSVTSQKPDALAADLARVAEALDRAIEEALAEEPARGVVLFGYSQGAMVALALAARGSREVHVAVGASWLPPALEPSLVAARDRIRAIRGLHGDADAIVPLAPTRALFTRLREAGLDATLEIAPGETHEASAGANARLAELLGACSDRARAQSTYTRPPEVDRVALDILLGPDVFVNASVAAGTPPEHIARRVLGKPGAKPKSTSWVMAWTRALLTKAPGFRQDHVDAQMKTIEGLLDVVEVKEKTPENDWVKGLVASAKAAGLKRVVTDHPDLADKTEVDGIAFLSSEAWLVEQTTPPPPPPPKKK